MNYYAEVYSLKVLQIANGETNYRYSVHLGVSTKYYLTDSLTGEL